MKEIFKYTQKKVKSGEISKYNVGYAYHLSLHKRDIEILKNIKDKLNNVGTIYEYVNKPDSRLAVNDKAGLLSIIHNVFDVFPLQKNQLIRYLLLKDGLVNNVKEFKTLEEYNHYKTKTERLLSINPSSPRDNELKYRVERLLKAPYDIDNWIIGFINGEGCFYINKTKCNFFIEHTDREALEIIKRRLEFGPNVLERSPRLRDIGKAASLEKQLIS